MSSSRRYPTAELYEERQRDFYRNGNRSDRSYDELDIDIRRSGDPRRSAPDFLREDYNRTSAGPLVVRKTEEEFSERGHRGRREVEQDTLVIRGGRRGPPSPPSSVREVERDEFTLRRSETERPRRREFDTDETDITIRRREQSRGPSRPPPPAESVREVEREDITFRRGDGARPRPREVEIEREEVRFQERGPPRREEHRDEVIWRHDHREESRHGRDREVEKDTLVIRGRERSLPPPRSRGELVAREREEFVVRRRDPSPPSPRREVIKDEIIIRRREERSPSPAPLPPPPPPPEPEIRPPIIQEIITHHRHIDHGVERARSPTPPPPPPSPPRDETLEISIRRKESRGGGLSRGFEEDIIFSERETTERRAPRAKKDMWTEITKDLVVREAIDSCGYDCEETDDFFYVMEYLRYEDVLRLVEISDDIRRRRKSRIREIEFERESIRAPRREYDERFYEREVSYDRHRHRGGFR